MSNRLSQLEISDPTLSRAVGLSTPSVARRARRRPKQALNGCTFDGSLNFLRGADWMFVLTCSGLLSTLSTLPIGRFREDPRQAGQAGPNGATIVLRAALAEGRLFMLLTRYRPQARSVRSAEWPHGALSPNKFVRSKLFPSCHCWV